MRADRLVAALLVLQARGRITAAELARELEVSTATARRDLEALSAAGIPVYPQAGRGGGWQLLGGARTDLTGLTAAEARALFALLGPARSADPAGRSALRKLLRALPATFRAEADAAARAVVVDPAGWGARPAGTPPHLEMLRSAVIARASVRMTYAGRRGESTREAHPWGLIDKDGSWYLVAGTDAGRRTFRLDRIRSVSPTGATFDPPADLDLDHVWEEVVESVERRRGEVVVNVGVAPGAVGMLRRRFGRHAQLTREPGGEWSGTVGAGSVDTLARLLASFADAVTVRGDDEAAVAVRARLVELGRALVLAHAVTP